MLTNLHSEVAIHWYKCAKEGSELFTPWIASDLEALLQIWTAYSDLC